MSLFKYLFKKIDRKDYGKIKRYLPLPLITVAVLLGFLTFFLSTGYLINAIKQRPNSTKSPEFVVKTDSIPLTISQKEIVKDVPTISSSNNQGGKSKARFYLNVFPGTLNWIMFHSTALSLAMTSLIFVIALILRLKIKFKLVFLSPKTLLLVIPLLLLVAMSILFERRVTSPSKINAVFGAGIMEYFEIIFDQPKVVVKTIERSFYSIGVFSLFGITTIIMAANKFANNTSKYSFDFKKGYKTLKDGLNVFALFTGLLVGVSVIGTSLQKKMIAEQVSHLKEIYPDEFIYAYGLIFTFILALFFLPALVYLKYLKKNSGEIEVENKTPLGWWNIGQESLDDIKLIFSIILPLLTTVVQSFIE